MDFITDYDGVISESQVWDVCPLSDAPQTFLATNDGLFVFDGARLRRYYTPQSGALRDLAWDSSSRRLYSAGNCGYGWWQEDKYGSMAYHPLEIGEYSAYFRDFWRVCISKSGLVLFQSHGRVCVYNPESESLSTLFPRDRFHFMHQVNDDVYVQDGDGLFRIDDNGSFEWICMVQDRIMAMVTCAGRTVAALERTGLMEFDGNGLVALHPESNRILADAKVMSLVACEDNLLFVGTTRGGLFTTTPDGRLIDNETVGFEANDVTVLSLGEDLNGDIWLGMESGVARLDMSSNNFYLEDARLGRVRGIVPMDNGRLLMGANKGAFVLDDGDLYPVPGTIGSVWSVNCFDGLFYIAHDRGLFVINEDGEATPVYTGTGIMSMTRSSETPGILVCGTYNGLALFRQEDNELHFESMIENYSGFCRHILMVENNELWIRDSQKGFIRLILDIEHRKVTDRKDFVLVKDERDVVYCIQLQGRLIFCCNRETYCIDPENRDLVRSLESDSLLEDFGRMYGIPTEDRNASGPFQIYENCYATGLYGAVRFSYPGKGIVESLAVSQLEALGAWKRADIDLSEGRADIPHDMNTVQVYLAGNLMEGEVEYRTSSIPDAWQRIPFNSPVQISALPFGNCDIEFRVPGHPEICCTVKLNILRPWYLSNWAILAYVLLIAAMAYGIRTYYQWQTFREKERISLRTDLKSKSKELANITFNNAKRNHQLKEIRAMLTDNRAISHIDRYLADESDWEKSEEYFNVIYDGMLEKLKALYPGISKTDMKICVYTKLNLSTKEIADLMNISIRSVEMARYRLRKRLGLPQGQDIGEILKNITNQS
ncbi:MAG: sigma-70 family RNA polymerase sigma factor [Bacteroidales bacterium]|nr:sigma-70 family RNA polymerase sigma factor [Bacteroidales bacterium]